jgi:hypothetical protein
LYGTRRHRDAGSPSEAGLTVFGIDRPWAFGAATTWFLIAVVSLFGGLILVVLLAYQLGATVLLAGALIPFLVGRGILIGSGAVALLAVLYGVGIFLYTQDPLHLLLSGNVLALWPAAVSAAAAVEIRRRAR